MTTRIFALAVAVLLTSAGSVSAQEAATGFGLDVAFGEASGKGGEFLGRDMTNARLAASVRRLAANHVGLFGELGVEFIGHTGDHVSICLVNSKGGCVPWYPVFAGPTALAGVIADRGGALEMRIGIGGAAYHASSGNQGSRIGAAVAAADASLFPVPHVGILAGMRWIVVPRYQGDRLSMTPWSVGLRIR